VGVVAQGRVLEPDEERVARPGPPPQNLPIPPSLASEPAGTSPQDLIWPDFLSEEQRPAIFWHLSRFPAAAQSVLDEMAWTHSKAGVRNPAGFVRTLVALVAQGTFVPEGAPEIQRRRKARAEAAARSALSTGFQAVQAPPMPASSSTPQRQTTDASLEARERLRAHVERARRAGLIPTQGRNA
jgi:hypothetical protein